MGGSGNAYDEDIDDEADGDAENRPPPLVAAVTVVTADSSPLAKRNSSRC